MNISDLFPTLFGFFVFSRRKSSSLPKKKRPDESHLTTSPMTCSSQVKTDMAVKVPRKTRSLLTPPYWSSSYFSSHFSNFFINCNFSNFIFPTIRTALSETLNHWLSSWNQYWAGERKVRRQMVFNNPQYFP